MAHISSLRNSYAIAIELLSLFPDSFEVWGQKQLELASKKYRLIALCHHNSGAKDPHVGIEAAHKAISFAVQADSATELSQLFQLLARFKQSWKPKVVEKVDSVINKKSTTRRSKSKSRDSESFEGPSTPPSLLQHLQATSIPEDKIADLLFEELAASRGRCELQHLTSITSDIRAVLPAELYPYRRAR